jgi:AcrR family transcriptional regulator
VQAPDGTKQQILQAAFETLRDKGFAAATSRAIADRGRFNAALVFYYFGSVDALLLAALDWTNGQRLSAYREALAAATTIDDALARAARLFEEDRDSGHVTVVSQMIAGSVARPELAPETLKRMEPWLAICEETVERVLGGTPLATLLPSRDVAYAIVNFYLGANLLTHLEGDRARADELLERLRALAGSAEDIFAAHEHPHDLE